MFVSPIMEELSGYCAGNHEWRVFNTRRTYTRVPYYNDDLYLDASEMAMLELLVLYDSSGACCGFYDDLLMSLRWHGKKGFIISKAKRWDSFLSDMRKKVPTPQLRTTIVSGHEIFHFRFLEMLHD
jgi:hypothetical protein